MKKKGLKRIRYTTSHPKDMSKDLIDAHKNCKKLMPLLHLPIQSGSDKILKIMNRKHNIEEYLDIIDSLKEKNSNIEFSSDFIIAYPGESDTDFNKTCELMQKVKFINSYSFIFSPRPGTPASDLELIDQEIANKRLRIFQKIAEEIKLDYKKRLIEKPLKILFENKVSNDENYYFGRDEHQNPVISYSKKNIIGEEKNVVIKKISKHTIFGEITDKKGYLAA